MALSAYAEKLALDWLLGGAAASGPSQRWLGLSLGSPTSTSASELGATSRYTRATVTFAAAASPGGIASEAAAASFGSFVAGGTLSGWQLWDTQAVGSGNMLWCGLLSAATSFNGSSGFTMSRFELTAL